jgi:hypothetical protein
MIPFVLRGDGGCVSPDKVLLSLGPAISKTGARGDPGAGADTPVGGQVGESLGLRYEFNPAPVDVHHRMAARMSGPIPLRVLRPAQFHEFVVQLVEWAGRVT